MPHVEIKCFPGRTEEQKTICAEKIAEIIAESLGCETKSVSVAIKDIEKAIKYPMAAKALLSVGMHCVTCGVALYESVEEASYVHGLEPDDVIKVVNDILTTELIEHPGEGLQ